MIVIQLNRFTFYRCTILQINLIFLHSLLFLGNYNLQYHIAHHLNERKFVCDECPRAYNTTADLVQHQRSHELGRDPYKCEICGILFKIRSKLNTHMRSHKTPIKGTKECPVCGKTVLDVKRHHETVHENVRNHQCESCPKKFYKKSGLERHILTVHQKQKNFVCDVCDRAFGEKSLLLRHTRRHLATKTSFYCTICKKYVDEIKGHYDSVHKDLPHKCEHCHRRFLQRREWNNHVTTRHTKFRSFLCQLCGKGFVEKYQLKRHFRCHINVDGVNEDDVMKLIENIDKTISKDKRRSFNCKFCDKKFKRKQAIENHLIREHKNDMKLNEPAKCDLCGSSFNRMSLIISHMMTHLEPNIKVEKQELLTSDVEENFDNYDCTTDDEKEEEEEEKKAKISTLKQQKSEDTDFNFFDCSTDVDSNDYLGQTEEKQVLIESITIKKETSIADVDEFNQNNLIVKSEPNSDAPDDINDNNNSESDSELDDSYNVPLIKLKEEKERKPPIVKREEKTKPLQTNTQIRCKVCHKTFTAKSEFRNHFMTEHADDKKNEFECKECASIFNDKKSLISHFKKKHEKYKCNECDLEFSTKHKFNDHNQQNHLKDEVPKFICSFCGKILLAERNLKFHIQAVHSDDRHECNVCQKTFTYKSAMYRHREREHGKGKAFECNACHMKVGTRHELTLHNERHHNSNRPNAKPEYMCNQCGICFPSSFVLTRHKKRIHEQIPIGTDQRKCQICHEVLKDKYWKKKHMAQVHLNGEKTMRTCKYCSTDFQYYEDFKKHIESHVGMFICTVCGEFFNDVLGLSEHGQVHKGIDKKLRGFECDFCGHRLFTKIQTSVSINFFFYLMMM